MAAMAAIRNVTNGPGYGRLGRRLSPARVTHVANSNGSPIVSVVVPCYNYAHYLTEAVKSVTSQDGVELEVIVVDDASADESVEVAQSIAEDDRRVRVIGHSQNRGHIATYNEGLAQARGKYLVLLSADDMLAPGSLSRAVALLESEPAVGFVYGRVPWFTESPPPVDTTRPPRFKFWSGSEWLARRCRRVTNCVMSPEVVIRRDLYERIGPYRPDLPHTGDMAMWLLASAVADVGYVEGPWAAYYRRHAVNMHAASFRSGTVEGMLIDLEQRRRTFEVVFEKQGAALPNGVSLHNLAKRSLAAEALAAAARAYTWGLTGEWDVEGLQAFARETWAEWESLPQWRALRRRRRLGLRLSKKNPCFVATEWRFRTEATLIKRVQERTGA